MAVAVNLSEEYKERMSPPYVLIMIDADSSASHTSQSCALHWMVRQTIYMHPRRLLTLPYRSPTYTLISKLASCQAASCPQHIGVRIHQKGRRIIGKTAIAQPCPQS